jgi:diphthamide synthase (EF-2-diphthine--ammonia ligase)
VNENFLDKSFCGRFIDEAFVNDLPVDVDVCGENGEFHSFVFDGPIFNQPVAFKKGDIVEKTYRSPTAGKYANRFYFCDLLLA